MSKFGVVGVFDRWKKGDLPGKQMVNIVLNSHSVIHDGSIAITAQLATDQEIDEAIDSLINDLELARNNAKKIYLKLTAKLIFLYNYIKTA